MFICKVSHWFSSSSPTTATYQRSGRDLKLQLTEPEPGVQTTWVRNTYSTHTHIQLKIQRHCAAQRNRGPSEDLHVFQHCQQVSLRLCEEGFRSPEVCQPRHQCKCSNITDFTEWWNVSLWKKEISLSLPVEQRETVSCNWRRLESRASQKLFNELHLDSERFR